MLKNGWEDLPTDILGIVFYFLEKDKKIRGRSEGYINVPSLSFLQCQLTCKSWSSLAQSKFYDRILLKSPSKLDLLIDSCSRTKHLVHHITFNNTMYTDDLQTVIRSFRKIALHFTELKTVCHGFSLKYEIFHVVKTERSKGRFSRLQEIPFEPTLKHRSILKYNDMAWDMRNSLRQLNVYDAHPRLSRNEKRLSHFPSIDAIYFNFRDFSSICTIDQQLQKLTSVRSVEVTFPWPKYGCYRTPISVSTNVCVLPQVKKLSVKALLCDCHIYSYLVQVFPNLDTISLSVCKISRERISPSITTEVAIRFLQYLLRVPSFYVDYIPFKNIEQVMMGFHGPRRMIKGLDIKYIPYNMLIDRPFHLSVYNNTEDEIFMEMHYNKMAPKVYLPRIGVIEHNGDTLEWICIDMGFLFHNMKSLISQENSGSISSILYYCPNLKSISIMGTLLHMFGTHFQKQKIPFVQEVMLHNSLVYRSFLYDMSFHLPFVDQFTIDQCRFDVDGTISILMPDTKFTDILYHDLTGKKKFYLKLSTLENSITRWFVGYERQYRTCSEDEYQDSLQDINSLSFFIQCKQVDVIYIDVIEYSSAIKIVMK